MPLNRTSPASCLLCHSSAVRLLDEISSSALPEAYRDELGLAITYRADHVAYMMCDSCDLRFFWPVVTGTEEFYAELQKISWYYNPDKQEFRIAAAYVSAGDAVLEIGAGRGLFSRQITGVSYTGLEFSPAAIQAAAADGIRLLAESVEHHAQANGGRYAIVCAFQVLEHVADPRSFLEAAVGCLRDGGRLIISVPGEDSFAQHAYWDVLNMPPHHVTRWTDACLRSVASLCGLRIAALVPEPLGRNMRRAHATALADRWLADLFRMKPRLLDKRLKRPVFRSLSAIASRLLRTYLSLTGRNNRRGHSVVAVYEKSL